MAIQLENNRAERFFMTGPGLTMSFPPLRVPKNVRRLASLVLLLGLPIALPADVRLASLFADHMVLQRDARVPIWGWGRAGEKVTISFGGQTATTTTGADEKWLVRLGPFPATANPAELVVTAENVLRIKDVVVGEVWLCSGQSNMAFTVGEAMNAPREIAAAEFPLIRHFGVKRTAVEQPATTVEGEWLACTPETVARFTAVGYFFARDIHRHLGVPIGIINSSWGGTVVEAWMSEEALRSDPKFAVVLQRRADFLAAYPNALTRYNTALTTWKQAVASAGVTKPSDQPLEPTPPIGPGHRNLPMNLYHGMIAPLAPYALRGVLWYQGEANGERVNEYQALFAALIQQWRRTWDQGAFPFYFVQLSGFKAWNRADGEQWGYLREAQTHALALPNTGMAVTIDIGDPDNVHPINKQEVGRRLALIAKARTYGHADNDTGPVFVSSRAEGSTLVLQFAHAEGLNSGAAPVLGFELAGEDQAFVPAQAVIGQNGTVTVSAQSITRPVAARYAWRNAPVANLRNSAGLPAGTFRTGPYLPFPGQK